MLRITAGLAESGITMPLESHIDAERQRVGLKIVGDCTIDEVLKTINLWITAPRIERGFSVLSDHTLVGKSITTEHTKQLIEYFQDLSRFLAGARWAAVTSKPASYGMIRMISAFAESVPMEVEVFQTFEEADAWLLSKERAQH